MFPKKITKETKSLAYMSLVHPILEYGAACWNTCTEGQINALDRVQKKATQYTNHTQDSDYENLSQCRTLSGGQT